MKILLFLGAIVLVIVLAVYLFQQYRTIPLPCVLNRCPLGGTCSSFQGSMVCLQGYNNDTLCNYCDTKQCSIGESYPLSVRCLK